MKDLQEWFLWTPCCGRAHRPVLANSADLSRLYDEHLRFCPRAFTRGLRPEQQPQPVDTPLYDEDGQLVDDGEWPDDPREPLYAEDPEPEYDPWRGRGVIDVHLPDDLSNLAPTPPAPGSAAARAQSMADHLDMKGNTDGQRS